MITSIIEVLRKYWKKKKIALYVNKHPRLYLTEDTYKE